MSERLLVDGAGRLLDFLRQRLGTWKRATLEQRLREGCVRVNGAVVNRREHLLAAGDEVLVLPWAQGVGTRPAASGLTILYSDEDLIAIDKPSGLLSVATELHAERNALALVRSALARPGKSVPLWPAHRLDREASGVLLFAKSRAARAALQASWSKARKTYLAIVEGQPDPPNGVIEQPLFEDRDLFVRVGPHPNAKPARTRYASLRSLRARTLLEVELDTGRRHQIRAHLAWLGHPIVGDPRYGTSDTRMALHAKQLVVPHPRNGEPVRLEAVVPEAMLKLL